MTLLEFCELCQSEATFAHDHKPDNSGLDDGPPLPWRGPRKKAEPVPAEIAADRRKRAWETRRAKWGQYGHR